MKTSLLATAAAVTIALMASTAQAEVAGHVGANYARSNVDVGADDLDLDNYQIEGAAAFNLNSLGAVLDLAVTNVGGDINDVVDYSFTGHLNGKFNGALVGGFAGVYATKDLTIWSIGAEGQVGLNEAVSLYGQAGYGYSDELDAASLWALRGELRYFFSENVKLQGTAGWNTVDARSADYDTWALGVDGEYQFAGTPWSITAGYEHADSDDLDVKADTFRIGGRYTFGGATLKARDAAGADLGSVRKLFTGVAGF